MKKLITFLSFCGLLTFGTLALAAPERVIHSFGNGNDGYDPRGGLIFDASGNAYGTTAGGGTFSEGTVFELSPTQSGPWTETILYNFAGGSDGAAPIAGLVFDAQGNLYGTTQSFGDCNGCGTVFELSPTGGGAWTETTIHNFSNTGSDGWNTQAGLVIDSQGNLYGTTQFGGSYIGTCANGCGTVFELSPDGGGTWTENIIFAFNESDGESPQTGLTFDSSGNLWGTVNTESGDGTVYELSPASGGTWNFSAAYNFCSPGCQDNIGGPSSGVIFDGQGNMYGETFGGGTGKSCTGGTGCGAVYELSPAGGGTWTLSAVHVFAPKDGRVPVGGVIFDPHGNLYGVAEYGWIPGPKCGKVGCGGVFELSPQGNGQWTETVLHKFGIRKDGKTPRVGVVMDAAGNLYGTTTAGGGAKGGTVYRVVH